MKRHLTRLLMLSFVVSLLVPTVSAFDFSEFENRVSEFELDNGLRFVVFPRHDAPVISCITHVGVGCAMDPKGYMGLAHMFEHMAFKGTTEIGTTDYKKEKDWIKREDDVFAQILKERAKGPQADSARIAGLEEKQAADADSARQYVVTNEFSEIVAREGGIGLNAGTSYDNTTYYVSFPSNRLELWMAMESDRFADPVLRELYKEKQVVAEERRFRVESSPTGRLFMSEYLGLAFKAHPYGRCLIGEMSEIQNYNRPVMREYFKSHYVPRNMVIAIVGDVDPEVVHKMARKYFGRLEDRPRPLPIMIDEPDPYGVRTVVIHENSQPMFVAGYQIPSMKHPDWIAIQALADYLGSGRTSALYKKLVKEEKTAVDVNAFAGYPGRNQKTLLSFICVPSNESSNAKNEELILAEIDKVRTELIPEKELEKIKAETKADLINRLQSNMGLAVQLAYYELNLGDWSILFKTLDQVNALTREDIKRVAEKYLDPDKRVVAYLEKPEA
jgi:predicted Zn-dependent peptidase